MVVETTKAKTSRYLREALEEEEEPQHHLKEPTMFIKLEEEGVVVTYSKALLAIRVVSMLPRNLNSRQSRIPILSRILLAY